MDASVKMFFIIVVGDVVPLLDGIGAFVFNKTPRAPSPLHLGKTPTLMTGKGNFLSPVFTLRCELLLPRILRISRFESFVSPAMAAWASSNVSPKTRKSPRR